MLLYTCIAMPCRAEREKLRHEEERSREMERAEREKRKVRLQQVHAQGASGAVHAWENSLPGQPLHRHAPSRLKSGSSGSGSGRRHGACVS